MTAKNFTQPERFAGESDYQYASRVLRILALHGHRDSQRMSKILDDVDREFSSGPTSSSLEQQLAALEGKYGRRRARAADDDVPQKRSDESDLEYAKRLLELAVREGDKGAEAALKELQKTDEESEADAQARSHIFSRMGRTFERRKLVLGSGDRQAAREYLAQVDAERKAGLRPRDTDAGRRRPMRDYLVSEGGIK